MPRKLVGSLIQAAAPITDPSAPIGKVVKAAIDAYIPLIEEAGRKGVQIRRHETDGSMAGQIP